MPVGYARLKSCRWFAARTFYACGLAALVLLFGSRVLQNAVAEGDTRTISLHHIHTDENITITFKRDGRYDEAALEKLNWFLRDWRREQANAHRSASDRPDLGGAARDRIAGAGLGRVRLSVAGNQRHAAAAQQRRRPLQPAHARPRHGFLYSRRAAGTASRHRLAAAARRRRLLSDLRLAVRAHGHRRRAALAAHDPRAIGPRVPRRPHRAHPLRRPAAARLCAGARRYPQARQQSFGNVYRRRAQRRHPGRRRRRHPAQRQSVRQAVRSRAATTTRTTTPPRRRRPPRQRRRCRCARGRRPP